MKTALVVSDTHGNRRALDELEPVPGECDYIIHLGDYSTDGGYLQRKYPQKTYVINGNCELAKVGEDEIVLEIEGVKIFACHGHRYSVKTTLEKLAQRAKELGCGIALYGHTHEARDDEIDGVALLNPGTLSAYADGRYLYLVISQDKFTRKIVWTKRR